MGGIAEQKAAKRALRKAQTLDLMAEIVDSQQRHGEALNLFQDALAEHTQQQLRLAGSFWARVRWMAVGR